MSKHMSRRTAAAAIAMLSAVITAGAKEQIPPRDRPVFERPAVRIAPTDTAPTIDGVLDDACWSDAVTVRPFSLCYQAEYASFDTEAMLTYDATHLYVGFRCLDPDSEWHDARPYPPAKAAATAEVLIDGGVKEHYYKAAITTDKKIATTQWGGGAMTWQAEPRASMANTDDGWTAELAIPFAGLAAPTPDPLASWRVNLGRRRPDGIGNVAWAITYAWFYEPQFFGDLQFGGPLSLTAELAGLDRPRPGENPVSLALVNRGDEPAECEILVELEEQTGTRVMAAKRVSVPAGGTVREDVSYDLPDGTLGIVTASVRENRATQPLLRQSIPVNVPPNRRRLREAAATLGHAMRAIRDANGDCPDWYADALKRRAAEFETLRDELSAPSTTLKNWLELSKPLERLLGQAHKLWWWQEQAIGDAPVALGCASSLEKLVRDRPYTGPAASTAMLSAARNEYEGFQLVLVPYGQDLEDVTATPSPLLGPGGDVIPAEEVEVQWVDFVETRQPRHPIDYIGWFPDPLIPMAAADRTVSADSLHQPLWVTVHVPGNVSAGIYHGEIEVAAEGIPPRQIPLRVRVYDFDLPERPALKTAFWLNEGFIRQWYGWDEISEDSLRDIIAFLLRYRINPAIGWKLLEPRENFEFALARGLNTVQLGTAGSWPLPDDAFERLERHYEYLKSRDLLDLAFVYAHDEPDPSMYPEVRHTMSEVAKHFPGLRRVCTAFPPAPGLEGAVDTWVVTANLFHYDAVAERLAAGDELWFYGGPTMKRPYTNWYVDYTGIEERMTFWHCWKYGATGLLHWSLNYWPSNMVPWSGDPAIDDAIAAGTRWPEVPWNAWTYLNVNGEAQLVYPGTDGRFWSSVRLEVFRDGMEDYDYLAVLRAMAERLGSSHAHNRDALSAEATALLEVGPPIASDLAEFTREPSVLLERRRKIAQHIERLAQALGEGL